jgi:hypothetical protein
MANKGRSEKDFFGGGYTHYDSNGKKIGRGEPNFFGGGYTNYDAHGKKVGRTEQNFFGGGYTTYDNKGNKIGRTEHQIFGVGYTNYDKNGKKISSSDPQLFGMGYNHSSGGCYVATCVYGSYDCPEVWTLRRFRDETLASKWYGRAFIKIYYLLSPIAVKLFGKFKWFRRIFKPRLDKLVSKLNMQGVDNTPYEDTQWN